MSFPAPGDVRPVQGATVKLLGQAVTTNPRGIVVFKLPAVLLRKTKVKVSAGNTFRAAVAPVRLRHSTG
jgi:hypothetical protein